MPGDSTVPRGDRQSAQKWLDLAQRAVQEENYDLLVQSIAGLTRRSNEDSPWLEEILHFADCLTESEDHLLRAVEAYRFVADRTPCYDERWRRVKTGLVQAAVLSNDPELCMETFQYIRDREPKTESGQWDLFVEDFLAPFDLSDMNDYMEIFRLTHEHCSLGPSEEFCRIVSRALRQAGQGTAAQRPAFSGPLRRGSLFRLAA